MRRFLVSLKKPKLWFLLPAVLWALIFTLYPVIYALLLSVQEVRLGRAASWIGIDNFLRLFGDTQFWSALRFTVLFVLVTVTLQVIIGLALAVLVNREIRGRSLVRAILMLPLFATPVGIGYLGIAIFQDGTGPINTLLMGAASVVGLPPEAFDIPWRSDPLWASVAVGAMDIWKWTPFCFLIFLAGLQALPKELYEAAQLDTSRWWDIFTSIILPLLRPLFGIIILLRVVEAFKVIDIPFAFTKGGPGIATQTYTMYVWRTAFTSFSLGYASALGIFLLALVLIIVNIIIWRGKFQTSLFSR